MQKEYKEKENEEKEKEVNYIDQTVESKLK
jgi:hypothetical protein